MEQRVGRVDRVRSKTHRQLEALTRHPQAEEKLQVFYPHLRQTAEAYQVQTVLERLNRFLVLMHKDLKAPELDQKQLNLRTEVSRGLRDVPAITDPLHSAFPVPLNYLGTGRGPVGVAASKAVEVEEIFNEAAATLPRSNDLKWIEERAGVRVGIATVGARLQPFTLFLRSVDGHPCVRCVSPIGTKDDGLLVADLASAFEGQGVRVGSVYNQALHSYEFTIEGDVLMWAGSNATERIRRLVQTVTQTADAAEARLLETDPSPDNVGKDLSEEPGYAR